MAGKADDITLERARGDETSSPSRSGRSGVLGRLGGAPLGALKDLAGRAGFERQAPRPGLPRLLAKHGKPPSNPAPAPHSRPSQPVKIPPIKSKFDQLGSDEGDFTDRLVEEDFPADWGDHDDKQEIIDENGWNLLHYSIIKGFSNAVTVLVEEQDFDVNRKTKNSNMSPLKLALQKCRECLASGDANMEPYHGIASDLMKSEETATGADESVLKMAINFPVILMKILHHHPEFYGGTGDSSPLTTAIRRGVFKEYSLMGFIEHMLRQGADSVVMDLLNKDRGFLRNYKNDNGETALHTAAKLGMDVLARELMKSGIGEYMCGVFDKQFFTPICTAMVYHEESSDSWVKVIYEILSHFTRVPTNYNKCIEVIGYQYRGSPVIEYDIKSGKAVIVQAIMKLDVEAVREILLSESYDDDMTIVHIAAKYGLPIQNIDRDKFKVEYLGGSDDVDQSGGKPKAWPCDCAVENDQIDFLEEAWKFGREDWSHEIKTTCILGKIEAFMYLTARTKEALTPQENQKYFRLACQHGQASMVEYFLETIKLSPDWQPESDDEDKNNWLSALMLAADCDAADCVTLLLDHNASVKVTDHKGYNALCRAILNGRKKAVMAILTHSKHGRDALRFCTRRTKDNTEADITPNITPMRLLVSHMPDVARWVLNKQIIREPSGVIVYKYDLIDDFDSHYCTFPGPLGFLTKHLLKRRSRGETDNAQLEVNISTNSQYNKVSDNDSGSVTQDDGYKPKEYEAYNHMLHLMVKSKDLNILDHLLVGKVINHYWRFVIWQWMILRFVYLFITVWLTAFTLALPHPNDDICKGRAEGISDGRNAFLIFASVLLMLLSLVALCISGYTVYIAKLTIFKQTRFRVLFEIMLPFLTFMFVIGYGNDDWCSQRWQWNVGAFCTCLSWLTVLVTLKGFRYTATPVNMLFAIIKNFLFIVYVPILLIVAFAVPFFMLFNVPGENYGPYQDIGSTLGTVLILFTGEGDYEGQFNGEDSVVNFPFASYCIYFIFVIVVGILFNNLLVSLAVGEVSELQDNAKLEQYRLNVEGIVDGLEMFFPFIRPKKDEEFQRSGNIEHNEEYLEAEGEYKKAQEESNEFANSILQEPSEDVIQSKIDKLEVTFKEKFEILQEKIDFLVNKFEDQIVSQ